MCRSQFRLPSRHLWSEVHLSAIPLITYLDCRLENFGETGFNEIYNQLGKTMGCSRWQKAREPHPIIIIFEQWVGS